jgi:hypothetical protein
VELAKILVQRHFFNTTEGHTEIASKREELDSYYFAIDWKEIYEF